MAKFTPKAPIEKLPLAARKELRDNYEPKKAAGEEKVAKALKLDKFSFKFNANEIWPYNISDWQNPGYILASFAEGFTNALEAFVQTYGSAGIEEFNSLVSKSEVTAHANELGDDAPLIDTRIRDGTFQILFHHEKLAYHASSLVKDNIVSAIDAVPHEGLSLEAKHSINARWNAVHEELRKDIGSIVGIPDLILDPNFEENYRKVRPVKGKEMSFESRFGYASTAYFTGLQSRLEYDKVKSDELLQEGIQEALEKKTFKLRVVDQTKSGNFNGIACEDGYIYLETTPERWGFNANEVAERLVSSL